MELVSEPSIAIVDVIRGPTGPFRLITSRSEWRAGTKEPYGGGRATASPSGWERYVGFSSITVAAAPPVAFSDNAVETYQPPAT
jgi:hypothetical protein